MTPLTVTRTFLGPALSLCSQSQTPCQVPRVTRPSQIGSVRLEPRRQALAWAGMSSGPSQECLNGIVSGTNLQVEAWLLHSYFKCDYCEHKVNKFADLIQHRQVTRHTWQRQWKYFFLFRQKLCCMHRSSAELNYWNIEWNLSHKISGQAKLALFSTTTNTPTKIDIMFPNQ